MRWSVSGLRPSFVRLVTKQGHRSKSGLWARLRTAIRRNSPPPPGALRSGPGVPVSRSGTSIRYSIARRPRFVALSLPERSGSVTGILLDNSARQRQVWRDNVLHDAVPPCSAEVVGRKQVASSDIFDVPAERVIAQSRFVLCLISLLVAHLQPI